jgi:hypothetical protein
VRHVTDLKLAGEAELVTLAGQMFVSEPGTLTALDSRTARPRWLVRTGLGRHLVRDEGDLLVVMGAAEPTESTAGQVWSLAIDMGTGQVRWKLPGVVTFVGGLVVSHLADRSGSAPASRLTVYDLAGQPFWSKDPVPQLHTVDLKRQTVLVLDRALGELAEFRVGNGDLVARTARPELVNADGLQYLDGAVVAFFSDGRVVKRQGSEFIQSSGFPAGEGERTDCGPVWCAYSPKTFAITLLDKATGEVVSDERWDLAIHTDAGVLGLSPDFGQLVRTVFVFDPVTRRSLRLEGWRPVGPRLDARVVGWHGPLFLMSTTVPSRTFFAVVDRSGTRVVGSVPYEPLTGCAATSYLVACRVDAQTFRVWHPN